MARLAGKIKDFVEPQTFEAVQNFAADPERSLAAYRFTDATSDLLARWLDAFADLPRPPAKQGAARALAGLRGVGKSHLLTVFAALASSPELRTKLTDAHTATSARRLMDRRAVVVRVERGTRQTLVEEVRDGLNAALGESAAGQQGDDPAAMLAIAASRSYDATLIVVIDTAFGRETRVERNDGKILSELAVAARNSNAFVALALDDDIAGAEGVNAALVSAYQIDYLDPEHLLRVVDQYVLRKNAAGRVGLHDIYTHLRGIVPNFNWSEPRFAAIYPLHPLVADVAAAVRLYAPRFAFLSFAAEASLRAAGRPASSLVLIDEVFDRVENDLRRAEDLKEAFAAYDELTSAAGVSQFPTMQRLEVKLTLKALFILSLDGRGATPRELCAAMLFYDEANQSAPAERSAQALIRLSEVSGEALKKTEEKDEIRWRFHISSSSAFDAALNAAIEGVRASADFTSLLDEAARARFTDWPFASTDGNGTGNQPSIEQRTVADFYTLWRGTNRVGKLLRQSRGGAMPEANAPHYEWEMTVLAPDSTPKTAVEPASSPLEIKTVSAPFIELVWQPAALSDDETNNLLRIIALHTDGGFVVDYGEAARAALIALTAQIERIWTRIYLDEGTLIVTSMMGETGALPLEWTEEERRSSTLMSALSQLLAPVFDELYTQHPVFPELLGETEAARLIGDFFGGSNANDEGVQHLARTFAVPLGLAILRGGTCMPDTGDTSLKRAWVSETLSLTDAADGEVVPIDAIYRTLKSPPYGLVREAAQLVLAALVAGRRIELVTTEGDRISRRTLGRLLNWETIAGTCRAATILHSAEELTEWARLFLGDSNFTESIADAATREHVRAALAAWLEAWHERRLLESFEGLPEGALTTRAWNMANAVRKTFGVAADSVESALASEIPLEEGLQRIADAFNGSPQTFTQAQKQFAGLNRFTMLLAERERVRAYLCAAEPTGVPEIERLRHRLSIIADDPHSLLESDYASGNSSVAEFESLWQEFHERYIAHYAAVHDAAVGVVNGSSGDENRRRRTDEVARGDDWREIEALSKLSFVKKAPWEEVEDSLEASRNEQCTLDVREILRESPHCACAFRLWRAADTARFAEDLEAAIQRGRAAYRRTLALFSNHLAHALENLASATETDGANAQRASALARSFAENKVPDRLTRSDVQFIERALQAAGTLPPVRTVMSADFYGLLTRDELVARLQQWLDDIPEQSALVEVVQDENTGH